MMQLLDWPKTLALSVYGGYTRIFGSRMPQFLLVLGHMRSGSSLLLHLLVNHPDIDGQGEQNTPYRSARDLLRWRLRYHRRQGPLPQWPHYLVDQVNHNCLTPNPDLLRREDLKVLLLLRAPQPTIASLIKLSDRFYEGRWTEEAAIAHYLDRYRKLAELADKLIPEHALALTYRDLTGQTEVCLAAIQGFLNLESSLSSHYQRQPFTGKRGDPTEKIYTGRVLANATASSKDSPGAPEVLEAAYEECMERLSLLHWKNKNYG